MKTKKNKVRRIAIVGLGSIGKRHLRILKKLRPDIEIILVRSRRGKKDTNENLAYNIFDNINDIKLKLDGVIICSPAPHHLTQAKEFIKRKIPTLIEKPLSHNFKNIKNFKLVCKKFNTLVLVGYVLRYSNSLNFFNKSVLSFKAGKPISVNIKCTSYLPNWRPKKDYRNTVSARSSLGGGVLLELSHELDYSNWIFGKFIKIHSILNNSKKLDIDVEDSAYLNLISKKNLPVSIYLDFCNQKIERSCKLIGSKGTLTWNGIKNYVTLENKNGKIKKWQFDKRKNNMYENQLNHFINCIERKVAPKVSVDDGIDALNLVIMAKKSHKIKNIIKL